MGKMIYKIRTILRNLYVALGAIVMPYLVHAGYGMMAQPDADPATLTVPFQGRIVSEETGEPVEGIFVSYQEIDPYLTYPTAYTDSDGRFVLYAPEAESYEFSFTDYDGFENGGLFYSKNMTITRNESENPLAIGLHKKDQTVIYGTISSKGINEPVSEIRVTIQIEDSDGLYGFYIFQGFSDIDGNFSIQVPEREKYSLEFFDMNYDYLFNHGFRRQRIEVSSDEIKQALKVELEKDR